MKLEITSSDLEFVKKILPTHYSVNANNKGDGINCTSKIGIDENDEEHWFYIFQAIKQRFKENFSEVFHSTCSDHLDFTISFKK